MEERFASIGVLCAEELTSKAKVRLMKALPPTFIESALVLLRERIWELACPCVTGMLWEELQTMDPLFSSRSYAAQMAKQDEILRRIEKRISYEGLKALYARVPILETILPAATENSIQMLEELHCRLILHEGEIASVFFGQNSLGKLLEITGGIADSHNRGRSTLRIKYEKGTVFYKPRSTAAETRYYRTVEELFPEELGATKSIAGNGYGFCQEIERKPLSDSCDITLYYRNLGKLAALAHALGISDLHMENIIATGTKPTVVDLETLLTPEVKCFADPRLFPQINETEDLFKRDYKLSLFQTGLLPTYRQIERCASPFYYSPGSRNLPVLEGNARDIRGYEIQFLTGFEEGYLRCKEHKDYLQSAFAPLAHEKLRVVLRSTMIYAKIQRALYKMKLEKGKAREQVYKWLSRSFVVQGAEHLLAIAKAETDGLMEGDIPYFTVRGNGLDLFCGEKVVAKNYLSRSAWDGMSERLSRLGDADLLFEKQLAWNTLEMVPDRRESSPINMASKGTMTEGNALKQAEGCFDQLRKRTMVSPAGGVSWMTDRYRDGSISPAGLGLYDGKAGIALFAAALMRTTKRKDIREEAKRLVQDYLNALTRSIAGLSEIQRISEKAFPLGQGDGVGGQLSALPLLSIYLEDSRPTELAGKLIQLADRMDYTQVGEISLDNGTAGLLKTILTCPEYREAEKVHILARKCAEAMMRHRTESIYGVLFQKKNKRIVQSDSDKLEESPESGMGSGMAGMGCAITLAGLRLGREEYLTGGREALVFASTKLLEKHSRRIDSSETFNNEDDDLGYLSGASGVGFAALHCIRTGDNSTERRKELEVTLSLCRKAFPYRDDIAFGGAAAADLLIETGDREAAGRILGAMAETEKRDGNWSFNDRKSTKTFVPGFIGGVAGIGYTFLRFYRPEIIRSVL